MINGNRYPSSGHSEDVTPADLVFGHRFWAGQQTVEYLCEFLNVMLGYDYDLSVPERDGLHPYRRFKRLGLRRFVFLPGDARRVKWSADNEALQKLEARLESVISDSHGTNRSSVEAIRQLLQSFSAVVKSRSWYAKSLFPVHESFLMFEGYREQNKKTYDNPDAGFSLSRRNFYGRSGELVYLMLSAGTRGNPDRRRHIESRLKELLTTNESLGALASFIEQAWVSIQYGDETAAGSAHGEEQYENSTGTLGWLPDAEMRTFANFAEDLEGLLRSSMDPLEAMQLMTNLIGFHVVQYLYRRALRIKLQQPDPRPTIMVDAQGAGEERAIRQASVVCFARNQDLLVDATKHFLADYFASWLDQAGTKDPWDKAGTEDPWERLQGELLDTKEANNLSVQRQAAVANRYLANTYTSNLHGKDKETVADMLTVFWSLRSARFQDHFLPVHRKLSRDIGLVAPRTGVSQRYVLGDTLIKALVMSNIEPGGNAEFHEFVERLWDRYGLVIGPDQVSQADQWLRDYDVNRLYYQLNLDAFRAKLKSSGLLTEYSDATGLVVNRATQAATMEA